MNEKPTRWDYVTTSFVLLLIIAWAVYEYKTEPDKIPFEPIVGAITYLIALWGFARFRNVSNNKRSNKQEQNANSIFNIKSIGKANFSVFVNGGKLIALVMLLAIAIWQKNEITDLLGFNRFFRANDKDFKVLVLPFKQICIQNGKNYDAGFVVTERLNDIINKEKLKIKTYYWADYDFKSFNDETAKSLRKYHHADMIVFGAYQTDACSGDGSQVCINYITDEKWNVGESGMNLNRDYQKGGIDELKTGKLLEKVENIATFISLIAQVKSVDHSVYLERLNKTLNDGDFSKSSQAAIYIEIADKLREEGKLQELLIQYDKALKIYLANKDKPNIAKCYDRLGSTYTALGNLDKALRFYEDYYKLRKKLYEAYPDNVSFKNGLALSYGKLGETHTVLGNLDKALRFYEDYYKLTKELYEAYPNHVSFKNSLAISYSKLGETHTGLGNLDKSLRFYEDYYKLTKELYEAYPNNVDFKNDLGNSYCFLGITHSALGNLDEALRFYEDYYKLTKELYDAYPNHVSFKNGLAFSYAKLGVFYKENLKDKTKAKVYFKQAEILWLELVRDAPQYVQFQKYLAMVQGILKAL